MATNVCLHSDHLGSHSVSTNAAGAVIARVKYNAYGVTVGGTGTLPADYAYTGQRFDSGDGWLYDYNARIYDQFIGRFISADSIIPQAGNPQDFNRYGYGRNNPMKYTDPSGHCPAPPAYLGGVICMALFIQPDRVSVPAPGLAVYQLHGDGRTWSSNSDPSASRGYIWILASEGTYYSQMSPSGYIVPKVVELGNNNPDARGTPGVYTQVGEETKWVPASEANYWTVTWGDDGSVTVGFDLVLAGPLEKQAPHINGTVTFVPDGNGGYNVIGYRDGFPWAEAYYYDGSGKATTIFQRPAVRGNPADLAAIEPSPPPTNASLEYYVGLYLLNSFMSPQLETLP